ncbi:MAG: hypothetical protein ACI92E_001820, partial [Oceanicoccus sp.]
VFTSLQVDRGYCCVALFNRSQINPCLVGGIKVPFEILIISNVGFLDLYNEQAVS